VTSKSITLKITGMDALRKELKKLDLTDDLKDVNKEVGEIVVRAAKFKATTRLQQKAAKSLKSGRQLRKVVVTGGGARFPFFGGAEFGAKRNQSRVGPSGRSYTGHNQFEGWRGNDRNAGYFLYPAIRANEARIIEVYGDAIERITGKAFPN